ncbi:MAG: hypothetical protein KUG78_14995 [Kangiellaceae bacterium]|nr:hypothetical protein [Kangiellaceae bacterium]
MAKQTLKLTLKVWVLLLASHVVLAVVPSIFVENKITAYIPYHSVFTPLEMFNSYNVSVYGQVTENMFMAPITILGWSLVIILWLTIHFGLAFVIAHFRNKFR